MKLYKVDPDCPLCVRDSEVELEPGEPVVIRVRVVLGSDFPAPRDSVTDATFKYSKGDDAKVEPLGPENGGPPYAEWKAGADFVVAFEAQAWLSEQDFPELFGRMVVTTGEGGSWQEWKGVE